MTNYKLDTDTQVFFYEQEFYVLSNFSSFAIQFENEFFPTSEHAYHYMKFSNEGDCFGVFSTDDPTPTFRHVMQQNILNARSAHDAFQYGQMKKEYRRKDWEEVKVRIMKDILLAKTLQHPYVMKKLLETGNRELIEDSWRDSEWGWGPNKDGKNMLGKLWMELRDELCQNL